MSQDRPSAQPTVTIDNNRTRVTEWRFAPGAETGHHRHEYDYVVVPIMTGSLRIIAPDGSESVSELRHGAPYFRPAGVVLFVIYSGCEDFSFFVLVLS